MKDKKIKYYLGLDMGTSSVGWAVTDEYYNLLRLKGKDAWGIREFDEAQVAADRRSKRTARRNRQREQFRIGMLNSYFADEIEKVDTNFLARLENSKYYEEDKDQKLKTKNGIFADKDYTDKDYFADYPTIFHLRSALIHNSDNQKVYDVRLVYLALLNMYKHRGHFLNAGLSSEASTRDMKDIYEELLRSISEINGLVLKENIDIEQIEKILSERKFSRTTKTEELCKLFEIDLKSKDKDDKVKIEFLKLISGRKVNAKNLLSENSEVSLIEDISVDICFSDYNYEEKSQDIHDAIGDEFYSLIELLKEIYDKGVLAGIMQGELYLSDARVKSYEKHKEDLKRLKRVVKRYGTEEEYDKLFRSIEPGSYSAYVNFVSSEGKVENGKQRRAMSGRKTEDLYKTIKNTISKYEGKATDDDDYRIVLEEIEKDNFLPKQMTSSNGVIPNQAHTMEMKKILSNAEKYLPFLLEKDESELTVSQRIVDLFTFQIPYYIGPTSIDSVGEGKTGWVIRKEGKEKEQVYPWNFEDVIDTKNTSMKFIERMVRRCTYIEGERVLPKASLMYEKFAVLNEINNIKINDVRISVNLKQELFNELYAKGKKVTKKKIFEFFYNRGYVKEIEQISGIDINVNNQLSSLNKFIGVFGEKIYEDSYKLIAENIIEWCTIYGDSKEFLKGQLLEKYPEIFNDEKLLKRVLGFKFKDWGRLSKKFLELEGCKKETGECTTLIRELWESELNLMELLNSEEYTFAESLKMYEKNTFSSITEFSIDDLDNLYFSAPVKRMIWQTTLIIKELEEIIGCPPAKLFIEMTRKEEKDKKRTSSRKQQMLDLYSAVKNEMPNWKELVEDADQSGKLKSKKMYLYLTQMGKCMYTGETIDLQDLFNDNLYDIDHIYPRHFVKDDNLNNNMVLVKKEKNAHKSDNYPLENEIINKQLEFWKALKSKKLITEEKYRRLTGRNSFTEEQKADFIARQLVETGQGTKGIADLMKKLLPETQIVYSKASNVSEFRNKYDLIKCRSINEFHHANDAYLNIVVGNVYFTKFTQNPRNFIRNEYGKDKKKYEYNLSRMFDWNVERNGEVAWIACKKDSEEVGTIATVKKMMAKNTPLMTRYSYVENGQLFDVNPINKNKANEKNYIPLKEENRLSDVTKYGGYTSLIPAYFIFVEHGKQGKRKKTFDVVYSMYINKIKTADDLVNYCKNVLGLVEPRVICSMIKKKSLIKVDGYFAYIVGLDSRKNVEWHNAVNLCVNSKYYSYIKKIDKSVQGGRVSDEITVEKNIDIYNLLVEKHNSGIWLNKLKFEGEDLKKGINKFSNLNLIEQCETLVKIFSLSKVGVANVNLKIIGGSSEAGRMRLSGNMTDKKEVILVNQSITGLFSNEVDLLKL